MSFIKLCLSALMFAFFSSCFGWGKEIERPSRPTSVHGWQKYRTGSIVVQGEFVLQKGESTDNGRVGIKIVDIIPAKHRLLDSPELPKAAVQFFGVQDHATICERVFTRGSNRLDIPDLCKDKLEWDVVYIRDVNYDEGWVFFDLR